MTNNRSFIHNSIRTNRYYTIMDVVVKIITGRTNGFKKPILIFNTEYVTIVFFKIITNFMRRIRCYSVQNHLTSHSYNSPN